jgi:hypothetical protein
MKKIFGVLILFPFLAHSTSVLKGSKEDKMHECLVGVRDDNNIYFRGPDNSISAMGKLFDQGHVLDGNWGRGRIITPAGELRSNLAGTSCEFIKDGGQTAEELVAESLNSRFTELEKAGKRLVAEELLNSCSGTGNAKLNAAIAKLAIGKKAPEKASKKPDTSGDKNVGHRDVRSDR